MKKVKLMTLWIAVFVTAIGTGSLALYAADTATNSGSAGFTVDLTEIVQSIATLIAAFVAGLISVILNKIRQKYGLQVSAEHEQWIQSQAEHAVQYTSELAAKKLKADNVKIPGNALLGAAISLLVKNVPNLSKEQAAIYVQAALARIPGVGATGDKVIKA